MKHGYCKYLDHITLVQMKYYVVHVKWSISSNDSHGRRRKHHLKIKILEMATMFLIITSSYHPLLLTENAANGLVEAR